MVEIRNKVDNKLIGSGEIIEENNTEVKLHTSSKIFKKKNVIIEYVMLSILIVTLTACATNKSLNKLEKKNIKEIDSIVNKMKLSREIDFREEYDMLEDYK